MKITTRFKTIVLLMALFTCSSCTKKTNLIGIWDDNIKLSQKEAQFIAEKDSIIITTEGEWWWITGISLNGVSNFDLSGIDTSAKNFVINQTEFRIERRNATEIYIEMTKNLSNSEKILIIGLEAGDYFDGIKITQSAI